VSEPSPREMTPMLLPCAVGTIAIVPDEEHPRGWFTVKQGNRVEMHPIDYRELLVELEKTR
jgi:hypothetical protein